MSKAHHGARKSNARKWLLGFAFLIGSIMLVLWLGYRSTQTPPAFYRTALETPRQQLEVHGAEFERKVFQLSGDVQTSERWAMEFTEEEVNGWLAIDLPEKFPNELPSVCSDPRVAFTENQIQVAFVLEWNGGEAIVQLRGSLFCTSQVNQVGLAITQVNSGWISIPIEYWVEKIQSALQRQNITTTWVDDEAGPTALMDLSERLFLSKEGIWVKIDAIEVGDGVIRFSGECRESGPF